MRERKTRNRDERKTEGGGEKPEENRLAKKREQTKKATVGKEAEQDRNSGSEKCEEKQV